MPVYSYRALRAAGRSCTGVVDADSQQAAWLALRARGVYPTALGEDVEPARGRRVPATELAAVTRQLALLIAAGGPGAGAPRGAAGAPGDARPPPAPAPRPPPRPPAPPPP